MSKNIRITEPSAEMLGKIIRAREAIAAQKPRYIKCPYCQHLVIYAGFAQSESESISKNVTWTFRKRFQEGKPIFNYKCLLG